MSQNLFTETTWDTPAPIAQSRKGDGSPSPLRQVGLTKQTAQNLRSWMDLHDLTVHSYEAAKDYCPMTFEHWRTLVSATANGMPVSITWRTERDGWWSQTTRMSIVRQLFPPSPRGSAGVYVSGWGFSHPLDISTILSVEAPEADYSFGQLDS